MRHLKILYCSTLCILLLGCNIRSSTQATKYESYDQSADTNLVVGLSYDDIEKRWGDTDCIFEDKIDGRDVVAWGYGIDNPSEEVVGIPDCDNIRIVLYFDAEKLIFWGGVDK